MRDDIEFYYNEETGCWEKREEPYMTLEFPTKDDYELLMKKADFYDKNHDNIEQVKKQAVKQFAEMLKNNCAYSFIFGQKFITEKRIDETLKEYDK